MLPRAVIILCVAAIVGAAVYASATGVWGESKRVISIRAGSPGGGYGFSGGVK